MLLRQSALLTYLLMAGGFVIPQIVLVRVPPCKASSVPREIMADTQLPWLIPEFELT